MSICRLFLLDFVGVMCFIVLVKLLVVAQGLHHHVKQYTIESTSLDDASTHSGVAVRSANVEKEPTVAMVHGFFVLASSLPVVFFVSADHLLLIL